MRLTKALASAAAAEEEAQVERATLRSKAASLQEAQEAVADTRQRCEGLQRRYDEVSGQLVESQAMKHALQEEVWPADNPHAEHTVHWEGCMVSQ